MRRLLLLQRVSVRANTGTSTVPATATVTAPLPVSPAKAIRMSTDVDRSTANRVDRLAAQYQVPRAELLRAMVRLALEQQHSL